MEMFDTMDVEIDHLMLKYQYALDKLDTELEIIIKEFEFNNKYQPVEHVKSRIKSKESAIKKLKSKGYDITVDNLKDHVHDMVGFRIVCSFISDVYSLVNVIEKSKSIIIKEKKDYILNPKDSGYTSYHLIVLVPICLEEIEYIEAEIQIRTMAMDFWASLDHKIQYKFREIIPEEIADEMYNCSLAIKALDNKMYGLNEIVNRYKEN